MVNEEPLTISVLYSTKILLANSLAESGSPSPFYSLTVIGPATVEIHSTCQARSVIGANNQFIVDTAILYSLESHCT